LHYSPLWKQQSLASLQEAELRAKAHAVRMQYATRRDKPSLTDRAASLSSGSPDESFVR